MNPKIPSLIPLTLLFLTVLSSCWSGPPPPTSSQELYASFQTLAPPDTLAITLDTVTGASGQAISADLLLAAVDPILIDKMIYEPDTTDFQGKAYWKVSLDENYDACLLDIRQAWFQFKYLLIYSKVEGVFIDLVPAAFLYGGDGGQLLCESRIFDWKTQPTLLSRTLEHSLRWSETDPGEPEDILIQGVGMKQWSEGQFREVAVRDSSTWIEKYHLVWE